MFFKDTVHPKRILNALIAFNKRLGNRGETIAPFIEALPEEARGELADLASNPDLANIKSVKDLAQGYLDANGKLKSTVTFDTLPDEFKNDPNIAKYKGNLSELVKGHIETVKLIGRKGVIVPGENATEEERAKFLEAIGRPKTAEEYKITPLKDLHPSIKVTPESEKAFKDIAHKLGFNNAQVDGLNQWYMETLNQGLMKQEEATLKAKEEATTKLRQEWGADYNNNVTLVQRLVSKFGGQDGAAAFGDLGNNVAALRTLAGIAKKMSEDSISRGEFNELLGTAEDAKKKLEAVNKRMLDMEDGDPEYPKLLEERQKLYAIAYPEGSQE